MLFLLTIFRLRSTLGDDEVERLDENSQAGGTILILAGQIFHSL